MTRLLLLARGSDLSREARIARHLRAAWQDSPARGFKGWSPAVKSAEPGRNIRANCRIRRKVKSLAGQGDTTLMPRIVLAALAKPVLNGEVNPPVSGEEDSED